MGESYRCFAAVSLEPALTQEAFRATGPLRAAVRGVKWVPADRMHVTMAFYGDVPREQIPPLQGALRATARERPAVSLVLRGAGTFPPRGAPRVVWLGLETPDGGLQTLHRAVARASESCGFPRERRPFRAHLTLGRIRRGKRTPGLREALAPLVEREFGRCTIDALTLYRSELRPEGPRYTVLERFPLAAGGA